jgi:hypothetical protein
MSFRIYKIIKDGKEYVVIDRDGKLTLYRKRDWVPPQEESVTREEAYSC